MKKYLAILCLGFVLFQSCKTVQHISQVEGDYVSIDSLNVSSDERITALIAPYKKEMEAEMNQVIGSISKDLVKGRLNSSMGNWFADLLAEEAEKRFENEVDFAIQNYGGLRIPFIPKGSITKNIIFELMPFDNTLVLVELNKDELWRLCEKIVYSGGWPVSKNLNLIVKDSTLSEIYIKEKRVQKNKKYHVAMPDYISNGGDGCDFLMDLKKENSGIFIRKIIIENIEQKTANKQSLDFNPSIRINTDDI